jgi:hypothetical protein
MLYEFYTVLCPYFNVENFPVEFKILYKVKYRDSWNLSYFKFNDDFFIKVRKTKEVKKYKASKEFKSCLNLLKLKYGDLERLHSPNRIPVEITDCPFPLLKIDECSTIVITSRIPEFDWKNHNKRLRLNLGENYTKTGELKKIKTILFDTDNFTGIAINKQDFIALLVYLTFKLSSPISRPQLARILYDYHDMRYRYNRIFCGYFSDVASLHWNFTHVTKIEKTSRLRDFSDILLDYPLFLRVTNEDEKSLSFYSIFITDSNFNTFEILLNSNNVRILSNTLKYPPSVMKIVDAIRLFQHGEVLIEHVFGGKKNEQKLSSCFTI